MASIKKIIASLLVLAVVAATPLGALSATPAAVTTAGTQAAAVRLAQPAKAAEPAATPVIKAKVSSATATSVTLSWTKTSKVKSVQVFRSTKKTSGYKRIATLKNTTKYTAKSLAENKTYYFKVRVFYKNGTKSTSNAVQKVKVRGDYSVISSYNQYGAAHKQEVKDAVANFVNTKIQPGMSEYQKVIAAHDYLVKRVSYAPDYSKNGANSAWGALIYKQAQCSGYAWAFQKMCEAMGIGCRFVEASADDINPAHRWNMVKVKGSWYHIDVQCNDSSGWNAVLLAGDKYVRALGYGWNTAAYPKCPASYSA